MSELEFEVDGQGLAKSYGALKAVDGVDLRLRRGECFGILGPNGAGKTTTIKMLCGTVIPDAGFLRAFGLDVATEGRRVRERMGIVPQESTLDTDLTVYENLWVYAGYFGLSRRESLPRIEELLQFFHLREKWGSTIRTLSGGMKRRLLVARALIHRPRLLILDEPTTGLDPQARHLVWNRLRELRRQGLSILLTTHYMEEAAQLCDRVGVMDEGKFLVEGAPLDLVRERVGEEVIELRGSEADSLLRVLDGLPFHPERVGDTLYLYCQRGSPVMDRLLQSGRRDFLRRPATLEDLFLRLTGRELRE
ncbi:MAG: ATP-binding cassette domain-containing protein [Candidatus Tectomicrobia bacterium]|nr:ATP-binding cassette domain-containing protein [Candidatus Tectomicrobia bacterium]